MPKHINNGPLIRVENLNLFFGDKHILRDISIEIEDEVLAPDCPPLVMPQIISFIGPSGIGKSVFSQCLAGLLQPTSGKILIGPDAVPTKPGMVGMVAQNYPTLLHRTVLGNLIYAGRKKGMSKTDAREKALEYLEVFGLADQAKKHPLELSGGQRQRVSIIQQLMCSEHYLVLDEPLASLDINNQRIVCQQLVKLGRMDTKNTFVIVTHNIENTLAISTAAWILGRERTPEGEIIPGARIQELNLSELDLCGLDDPDRPIQNDPEFIKLVQKIKYEIFPTL
jgi:ABC-type nitrate/sulfonate/bicarbonate transport system ATPase subunit